MHTIRCASFLVMLLVASQSDGRSEEASGLFRKATSEYREARYRNAILLYDSLVRQGYADYRLYNNLGNSYFKMGQFARSRLNYERALLLAPGHEEVAHNLRVVVSRLPDRIEPLPQLFIVTWWNDLKDAHAMGGLFAASCLLFSLIAAGTVLYYWYPILLLRRIIFFCGIILTIFFSLNVLLLLDKSEDLDAHRMAVVMEQTLVAKSTPDKTGVDAFTVHEGLKVEITDSMGNWLKIRLPDGRHGWVAHRALERI